VQRCVSVSLVCLKELDDMDFLSPLRSPVRSAPAGKAKSVRPQLEMLETRELPATALQLDFVTANSPAAAGYQAVTVTPYSASRGFGWANAASVAHMDRGIGGNQDRDFHFGQDATFLADVANGTYDVTVHLGDPKMRQNEVSIWLEGQQVASGLGGELGEMLRPTFRVTVNDGQLTLRLRDLGGTNPNFALNALTIVPVSAGAAPSAEILGAPASGHSAEGVALSLSSKVTDPDQTTGFTYAWTVLKNGAVFATATTAALDFTPDDNGTYVVRLSVTDATGLVSPLASRTITVDNVAPTVSLGGPYAGVATIPVAFNVTAVDPSLRDNQAGFTYAWTFGDGKTSNLRAPSHVFAAAGTYTVTCRVTDKDGGVTIVSTSVQVDPLETFATISGVWSLSIPNKDPLKAVYSNPAVDGIALRTEWDKIETSNGVYDWSYLDRNIAAAAAAGKKVSISVAAGVTTPSWLYNLGAAGFTFTSGGTNYKIPVPWDPVFLAQWTQFVRDLGARYATNPAVVLVKITGINALTPETMLPRTSADNTRWAAIGYTPTKVENAWRTIADTFAQAFPKKQISLPTIPHGFPPIDNNSKVIASSGGDDVLARKLITDGIARYGRQFVVENHGLSTFWISGQVANVATTVSTGHQTLWNVTNDTTRRMTGGATPYDPAKVLQTAVNSAIAAQARFIEIYQADIVNTALKNVITYAHNSLANVAPKASITGGPSTGRSPEGTTITFGSSVTDANAVDAASGYTYAWTVTKNGAVYAAGNRSTFSFKPDDNGTYVVRLIATDRDGRSSAAATRTITVDNVAPTLALSGPTAGAVGAGLAFLPVFNDPGVLDHRGATWLWDFGDGTSARGAAPTHYFTAAGNYTVRVTATDKDGGATTRTMTVRIS